MSRIFAAFAALSLIAGSLSAAPALAQSRGGLPSASGPNIPTRGPMARGDQAMAREQMQAGRNMPIRDIERRLVPQYQRRGYEYLTFEYDGESEIYRFKFIRDGRVIFVDADPRTGRVVNEQE